MVSPVSDVVAWTVIGYTALIGVGRLLFTSRTMFDQLANRMLLWFLIGLVLYRCTPAPSVGSVPNQLALGCIAMIVMYLYGLVRLWEAGAESDAAWRRQRIYCAVAVLSTALTMLAGPFAERAGRLVEHNLNWGGLVFWTANSVPLVASMLAFTHLVVDELRTANRRPLVRGLCVLMLLSIVPFYADVVVVMGELCWGWQPPYPHIVRVELAFTSIGFFATTLVAGPVVGHLMEHAGLDRDGRVCRRLRPLWRDVTAAVPEIVMSPVDGPARRDTTARLLRMTVEIRDALLHLGPYLAAAPAATESSTNQHDESEAKLRDYACRLADAARSRRSGTLPPRTGVVPQPFPTAQDFDTELRQLLDLARVWPAEHPVTPRSPLYAADDLVSTPRTFP
ncbi:MAB_1171c family putative transporter [Nocardia brasiliensis]|uniref:MAB_1171c family putative transporter n=1 Tax=Nocardia brasiliensis TaxID=37326 RepID=UPI0033CE3773